MKNYINKNISENKKLPYPEVSQHIDVVHQTDFLFGQFEQGTAWHNTGIVDNDFNETMFVLDLFVQGKDGFAIGNITAKGKNENFFMKIASDFY